MSQESSFRLPDLTVRQIVIATLVIVAVGLCFWFLFRFYQVILLLVTAVLISTAIKPIVDKLQQRDIPRAGGVIVVYGIVLILLIAFAWWGVPILVEQVTTIRESLVAGYSDLREDVLQAPNIALRRLGGELPPEIPGLGTAQPLTEDGEAMAEAVAQAWTFVGGIIYGALWVITALILAFYWTLESDWIKQSLFLLVPVTKRPSAREMITTIEERVGDYIIAQGILCLIIGALSFGAYLLIGLPHVLLLAFIAAITEAIPMIGPIIGMVPAVVLGFSISPATAVWVIIAGIIIQQLENTLLFPRIAGGAVGASPLVALLAFFAFSSLFGVIGALIAIPVASVVQLLVERWLLNEEPAEHLEGRDQASQLRYEIKMLVQDIRSQVRQKEDAATAIKDHLEDSLEAIALDLDSLVARRILEKKSA